MSAPVKRLSDIGTPWVDNPKRVPEAADPARPFPAANPFSAANTFSAASLVPERAQEPQQPEPAQHQSHQPEPPVTPAPHLAPAAPPAFLSARGPARPAADYDREFREQILEWYRQRARPGEAVAPPPMPERKVSRVRMLQIGLLAGASAIAAFYLVGVLPSLDENGFKTVAIKVQDKPGEVAKTGKLAPAQKPSLSLHDIQGSSGEWLPLGANAQGAREGAFVVITGLTGGSRLSAGQALNGGTSWRVPAADVNDLMLLGSMGEQGAQDLTFELRLADGSVADRQAMRVDFAPVKVADARGDSIPVKTSTITQSDRSEPVSLVPEQPQQPQQSQAAGTQSFAALPTKDQAPAATTSAPPAPAASEAPARAAPASSEPLAQPAPLDRDEIELLVKRGEDFIATGDLAAARLILRRAATARDARAAFALASTYDPGVLEKLRVYGAASDVELAVMWYERAKAYGSKEAATRLQALARRMP